MFASAPLSEQGLPYGVGNMSTRPYQSRTNAVKLILIGVISSCVVVGLNLYISPGHYYETGALVLLAWMIIASAWRGMRKN